MSSMWAAEIDALCARLHALKEPQVSKLYPGWIERDQYMGLLTEPTFDETCPESLLRLRELVMDVAAAIDPFFHKAAVEAGVGMTDYRGRPVAENEHIAICSRAVEGFLEYDLQAKADEINESRRAYYSASVDEQRYEAQRGETK